MRYLIPAAVFFLFFAVYGCGFQLNRNRLQLPDQAESLAVSQIANRSYVPRLDLQLRDLLIEKFNRDSVTITSATRADLVLSFTITSMSTSKSEYSLDDLVETYDFKFSARGTMTVYDNRNESYLINAKSLGGDYSIKTESTDLTAAEIEEGREEALDNLSDQITQNMNDDF
jgi:outer membrane lipopolysaccharide assembly protein LptE/RlpB